MSKVSVVIPCYNRAAMIAATLDSVLNQSRPPDEVIVVDDGSTDDSTKVIQSFGNPVQVITQANRGPGAARNRGLEASSGEYIWFMDSDDLASHNQLETQLRALETSGCDLAYGPWIRCRIEDEGVHFFGPVLQALPLPRDRSMLEWQLGPWSTVFQACLFRRSALERAGRYETDMRVAEDGEYLVRILASGAKEIFVGEGLLFYRSGAGDQLTDPQDAPIRNAADFTRYFERIGSVLEQRLPKMPDPVRRELALEAYRHNRFCATIGMQGIEKGNPVMEVVRDVGHRSLRVLDLRDRLVRRSRRLTGRFPASPGMECRRAGSVETKLLPNFAGSSPSDH